VGGEPEEHVTYHRGGTVRARGQLLDGELHGYSEWFRVDGTLLRSGSFDRGQRVGVWTTYDTSGAPHKETRF
jgi:antitoxin component YwqK of YwqJK toxin-antitoxin module